MPEIMKNFYDCSMKSCMNSRQQNKELTFFNFPTDMERCLQWIEACERQDLKDIDTIYLQKNYYVCSLHFPEHMFLNNLKNRLQPSAVPILKSTPQIINNQMPEIECVVIINTPDANTSPSSEIKSDQFNSETTDPVAVETNENCPQNKKETLVIDEQRTNNTNKRGIKFSILRNILQENETKTLQTNEEIKLEKDPISIIDADYDLNNICRVCLTNNGEEELKQIEKDYYENILIIDMLQPCIDFKLPDEKKLPKKICTKCINDLKNVYNFIKKCKDSKLFLQNYINKIERQEQDSQDFENPGSPEEPEDINDTTYSCSNYSDSDNSSDNEPLANKISAKNIIKTRNSVANSKLKSSNRCSKCKVKFKYYNVLLNHTCDPKKLKKPKPTKKFREYQCSKCDEKFRHLYELAAHRKRVHRNIDDKPVKEKNPTRCARCDIIFPTIEELADHRKADHAQDRVVTCPVCSKKMSAKAYRSHKEIHCAKLKYCCEYCGRSFSSSSNFNRHMYIHFDLKPHVCEICGRGFRVRAKLTEHRLIHSTERRYMCETCGNSFRQKNVLRAHIQLKRCGKKAGRNGRGPVMKHECSECTEKFYTLKELRQHRSHTHGTDSKKAEARIYKCEKCEDSFTSTAFLKRHALIHAETKFICSTCNRAFYTLERLQKHESIHDAVKNFICEVCSKAFASKLSLKCHMTVHTGEKKYHCQLCPKTFSQAGQLTSHTRTHTGSRPYQCPYCERAFALNGNLTVHIRTHTGERPYKCKFCEQAFYDSSSAKKHMTVKHGYGAME